MAKLGNLYISLIADTAAFSSGLNKAKGDLNSSAAQMNRTIASVGQAFHGLGDAIVEVVGTAALLEKLKKGLESAAALADLSEQLGISTKLIQTLRFQAAQSGVATDVMETSVRKLTKTIGDAVEGQKAQVDAFRQLGVSVVDAGGKVRSTDAVLRDVSDALSLIHDPAVRARLEVELFGRAGQQIEPIFAHGAASIDDFGAAAQRAGVVLDDDTIAAAHRAQAAIEVLGVKFDTLWQKIAVGLSGPLTELIDGLNRLDNATIRQGVDPRLARLDSDIKATEAANRDLAGQLSNSDKDFVAHIQSEIDLNNKQLESMKAERDKILQTFFPKDSGELGRRGLLPVAAAPGPLPQVKVEGKTDAEKNIDKLTEKLRSLQDQLASLNGDAGTTLSKALAGLDPDAKGAEALAVQIEAIAEELDSATLANDAYAAAQRADADAVQQFDAEMQKGRDTLESLRTPIEIYRDRVAELQQLHQDGAIGAATYARGLDTAKTTLDDANASSSTLNTTMTELGSTFSSAFDDAVISGKSLHDVLVGLLQDVERLLLRASEGSVTDFLTGGNGNSRGGSSGGFLGTILSFLGMGSGLNASGFRGTGAGPGASGNTSGGGIFSFLGDILGSVLHTGGVAGSGGVSRRVPALAFAGAPRLHTGGMIGPGEVPAILRQGETVLTPEQMAGMGSGVTYAPVTNFNIAGAIDRQTELKMHAIADYHSKAQVSALGARVDAGGADAKRFGRRRR